MDHQNAAKSTQEPAWPFSKWLEMTISAGSEFHASFPLRHDELDEQLDGIFEQEEGAPEVMYIEPDYTLPVSQGKWTMTMTMNVDLCLLQDKGYFKLFFQSFLEGTIFMGSAADQQPLPGYDHGCLSGLLMYPSTESNAGSVYQGVFLGDFLELRLLMFT